MKATVVLVNIDNLYLDPNNYRLINDPKYKKVEESRVMDSVVQKHTMDIICGKNNENISDLLESFLTNGYLPVDQIQVRKIDENNYLVLEGNRRTATLKTIAKENYSSELFDSEIFKAIPVTLYEGLQNDVNHLVIMGLKHISGNKKWGEQNQAEFVKALYDKGISEEKIVSSIGISKQMLRKNLRALGLIKQYKESDFGDQYKTVMFPMFREIIGTKSLQKWLNWDDDTKKANNEDNMERLFALISETSYMDEDSNERFLEPALTKRDEIRILGTFINDEKALKKLEETRNLTTAYNMSKAGFDEKIIQPQMNLVDDLNHNIETIKQINFTEENTRKIRELLFSFQAYLDKKIIEKSDFDGEVYFDRIEKHFSQLNFLEYKQFTELKITNTKKINIIAGVNNAGKTSILEGIYLLCKQNSFSGIEFVIRNRIKTSKTMIDYEIFTNQIHSKYKLSGVFDNKNALVQIHKESNYIIDGEIVTDLLPSIQLQSEYDTDKQFTNVKLQKNKDPYISRETEKNLCPVELSNPFFLNENHGYVKYYHQSVKSKSLDEVIGFIRNNVSETIKDIRLVDDKQRFLVIDSDERIEDVMDISSYGEGLQRIFYITLLFASVKNGVLLIDEFEDAIHYQLLKQFAKLVEKLANDFNVQVFITTHSKECLSAFMESMENINEVSCYALVKKDNETQVRYFAGADYKYLLNSSDYDLRSMK